jgi:hypothetical protein
MSPYLPEAQVVMAQAALDHKRPKEAEQRLRKALAADLPVETLRRCQELYLWCLADQGRASEGVPVMDALKPLASGQPSEKGLVGMLETLCAAHRRTEVQNVYNDYHRLYPKGPHLLRVDLGWAKLLGTLGEAAGSAQAFQKVIQEGPNAPEGDEARLALATLLTDGRLSPKEAQAFPPPSALVADLQKISQKDGPARQTILVKLRLALKDHHWQEAIQTAGQIRGLHPSPPESLVVTELRTQALRGWVQESLDQRQAVPMLPYLDGEGIRCLTAPQRLALVRRLAEIGLPEASRSIVDASPSPEKPLLRHAALTAAGGSNPRGALGLLSPGGGTPQESLTRAQAQAALGAWSETRSALAKAKPGPERIQTILTLLNRPLAPPKETAQTRQKEAEAWLARAPERGADREPLAIFTADLRARNGNWRGALAFYPASPQVGNRAWVAFMRATCMARLGQKASALDALKAAAEDPAFRIEREALKSKLTSLR